jgi:hypothetical protein
MGIMLSSSKMNNCELCSHKLTNVKLIIKQLKNPDDLSGFFNLQL